MDSEQKKEFLELRDKLIEKEFDNLNDMQRKAVLKTEGIVLILAGAGSGKTTVLINRTANLIKYGCAYGSDKVPNDADESVIDEMKTALSTGEISGSLARKLAVDPCPAYRILTVTFTNKAANELKERLESMLGEVGRQVCATTFHSFCARLLRVHAAELGYERNFTIYDSDDSIRTLKVIQKDLNFDEDELRTKSVLNAISKAKNQLILPDEYAENVKNDYRFSKIAKVYKEYQIRLKKANAMDFDDLLLNTILLFKSYPDILNKYSDRFKYIMIDEYQDTNLVQYELVYLLAKGHSNLCVVGDDDQSIYKFRGATVENILNFEDDYPNVTVVKLEQNYRSTKNILAVANYLIRNNFERKDKTLWTDNESGDDITVHTAMHEHDEASYITEKILEAVQNGAKYSDCAVLYRMNTQSNAIEKYMTKAGIPHRVLCGHRFLDREEIKDMISYLSIVDNPHDTLRMRRIINKPRRAIGNKTVSTAQQISDTLGISFYDVISHVEDYEILRRANNKLSDFCDLIEGFIDYYNSPGATIEGLYKRILEETNYIEEIQDTRQKKIERENNIHELMTNIIEYEREHAEDGSLFGFLEEMSLMSDIDNYNQDADAVVLMTIHSAKGLEFPYVFIPGFEDGIFPSNQSVFYNKENLEEERRLAYVAITRAKKKLYITNSDSRILFGKTTANPPSVFLSELPEDFIERTRKESWSKLDDNSELLKRDIKKQIEKNIASSQKFNKPQFSAKKTATEGPELKAGDKVEHMIFGVGVIEKCTPMGNDVLLSINFDKVGKKMIMKNFVKLTVVK